MKRNEEMKENEENEENEEKMKRQQSVFRSLEDAKSRSCVPD